MTPILQTPRPPFNGAFRVKLDRRWSLVVIHKGIVSAAPGRLACLRGLTIDRMMQMVAAKGGMMRAEGE
jgi:hypothetical protein